MPSAQIVPNDAASASGEAAEVSTARLYVGTARARVTPAVSVDQLAAHPERIGAVEFADVGGMGHELAAVPPVQLASRGLEAEVISRIRSEVCNRRPTKARSAINDGWCDLL